MTSIFTKAHEILKLISNMSSFDEELINELEKELSSIDEEISDKIFIRLGVKIDSYMKTNPKSILQKLLNYLHDSKNLFLVHYIELLERNNTLEIRFTNLRIIISIILKIMMESNTVILSKSFFENILIDIEISELKNLLLLGYKKRPPFRAKKIEDDNLTYFKEIDINELLCNLNSKIKNTSDVESLNINQIDSISEYANNWWNFYREYIDVNYYEIRGLFKYYNGIHFHYVACKSHIESKYIDVSSGIALIEMKSRLDEGIKIDIDDSIRNVYEISDDNNEYTITLGYKIDVSERENLNTIEKSINGELIDIMRNINSLDFIDNFADVILSLYGYDKYKFDDYYLKRNISNNDCSQVMIKRIDDRESLEINNLKTILGKYKKYETIFLSNEIVPSYIKNEFQNNNKVTFIDKDSLAVALKFKINESAISRLLVNQLIVPNFRRLLPNEEGLKKIKTADIIISDLNNCSKGSGWKEYESICYKAIRYLFEDSFSYFKAEYQVSNNSGTDIRDLIVANTGVHDFWKSIKQLYYCNNIVFEFKNYSQEINNDALRQISDYLEKEVYGQFGIIFTRNAISKRTKLKQADYLNNRNKKMILIITDDILIDMIKIKRSGADPENVLIDLKFELETSL
ncbi:hypothetical protein [Anaerovorax odorimutans]|uniref:hypothetical protein n=1 Tax=Anaerovorax odorimutans TaxID=109327 RepID=UPI00041B016E|nr:hypothetical protein [Anaerovorax odorimutans]